MPVNTASQDQIVQIIHNLTDTVRSEAGLLVALLLTEGKTDDNRNSDDSAYCSGAQGSGHG